MGWRKTRGSELHPNWNTKMPAYVIKYAGPQLQGHAFPFACRLHQHPIKIIVQPAPANHVSRCNRGICQSQRTCAVKGQIVIGLELLIIPISSRVMHRCSQIPGSLLLAEVQLMMVLPIIVHLISIAVVVVQSTALNQIRNAFIIPPIAVFIRVCRPSHNGCRISRQSDARDTVPRLLGSLMTEHCAVRQMAGIPAVPQAHLHTG